MIDKIVAGISASEVVTWLVIAALVIYFVYKEWPEFRRRVSGGAVKASADKAEAKSIVGRLDNIEKRLDSIESKLQRDFDHINDLEVQTRKNARLVGESLEERGIIMRALLGCLEGLQEIGADGTTGASTKEIQDYLNRKAHEAL